MKVELSENIEKLLALMEESNILPLKKFVCEIKSFKPNNKIRSRTVCAYNSLKKTFNFKDFTCTYMSSVKVNHTDENCFSISYNNLVNDKKIATTTLAIDSNNCKLSVVDGNQKELFTFKFNSKRVYQFKEETKDKTK